MTPATPADRRGSRPASDDVGAWAGHPDDDRYASGGRKHGLKHAGPLIFRELGGLTHHTERCQARDARRDACAGQRRGALEIQPGVLVERRREHAEDALEMKPGSHGDSLAPGWRRTPTSGWTVAAETALCQTPPTVIERTGFRCSCRSLCRAGRAA